jgi:hypothetical protein
MLSSELNANTDRTIGVAQTFSKQVNELEAALARFRL